MIATFSPPLHGWVYDYPPDFRDPVQKSHEILILAIKDDYGVISFLVCDEPRYVMSASHWVNNNLVRIQTNRY